MANITKMTPSCKKAFIDLLRNNPSVTSACAKLRLSRNVVYQHKRRDKKFPENWDAAVQMGIGRFEDEIIERALDRNDKASAKLLMKFMRYRRRQIYG